MNVIDWARTGRALARVSVGIVVVAAVGAVATGRPLLWSGLALLVFTVASLGVITVSAWRAMLRAGERGDRLASEDVGLLPPRRGQPAPPHDR